MSTVNLLPKDHVQRQATRRANVLCVILFTIEMAGVVAAALVSEQSSQHTIEVRDRVNASYSSAAKLIAQMRELEGQKRTMYRKAQVTAALVERVPRSTLLAVITNALPEGASLTKFLLTTKHNAARATTDADRARRKKRRKVRGTKFDAAQKAENIEPPKPVVEMEVTGLAATDLQVAKFMAELIRNKLVMGVDLVVSQEKKVDKVSVREFTVKMKLRSGVDAIEVANDARAAAALAPKGLAKLAKHLPQPLQPGGQQP